MFFEDIIESRTSYKLKKLTETLNLVYGLEIDFNSNEDDLKATLEHFTLLRDKMLNETKFNGYFYDSEYSKSYLICEAIKMFLSEVAPTRKRKRKNVNKES